MGVKWYCTAKLQRNCRLWWVHTMDKTEWHLVCRSTDSHSARIRRWPYNSFTVLLMFGDVVSKAHEDRFIKSFGWTVCQFLLADVLKHVTLKRENILAERLLKNCVFLSVKICFGTAKYMFHGTLKIIARCGYCPKHLRGSSALDISIGIVN